MSFEVVERQPVRVAYRRHTGPFGEPVGRFWRNSVAPWLAEHELVDCPRYGISQDNPMSTPPEKCRYDACVELPAGLVLPDAPEQTIAGGRYAVQRFKGTTTQIGAAWGAFLGEVSASGQRLDESRPPFEHYPRGAVWDLRSGEFACEFCLAIAEQGG
jgi:AraC family transcriptional regulator